MAKSTGLVIAVGAISATDQILLKDGSPAAVIPIALATGIAAILLAGLEKISPPLAVGIAAIALITELATSGFVDDVISTTGLGKKT